MRNIQVNLLPWQKEVWKATQKFKVAYTSRGTGKTEWLITSACVDIVSGKRVVYCTPTLSLLTKEIFPRIIRKLRDWGFTPTVNSQGHWLTLDNENLFTHKLYGTSSESIDSFTGTDGIATAIIDEPTLYKNWEEVLRTITPTMRHSGFEPKYIMGCTPRPANSFSIWLKKRLAESGSDKDFFVRKGVTIYDNTFISDEERNTMVNALKDSPFYKSEVLGEEIDVDDTFLFPASKLFVFEEPPIVRNIGYSYGLDLAGSGRDLFVGTMSHLWLTEGNKLCVKKVLEDTWTNIKGADLVEHVVKRGIEYNARFLQWDSTGGYSGAFEQAFTKALTEQYTTRTAVNFGAGALNDRVNYLNSRAEMYSNLSKATLLNLDDKTRSELEPITATCSVTGKRQLVAKETIKSILGHSPDRGDSFALSAYIPTDVEEPVNNTEVENALAYFTL